MDNPTLLLIAIMLLVIVVGTAIDMTPTILILTPVLMPVVKAAGIDPVYFGVLFIINNAIGLITPPVGTVLNVVAGVGKHEDGRGDARRDAVHGRAVHRAVPAGALPAAGAVAASCSISGPHRPWPATFPTWRQIMKILDRRSRGRRPWPRCGLGPRAQDIKERTFKLGPAEPQGPPARQGAAKFAEIVAAKSGGKIKVNLFPGGQLGGDVAAGIRAAGRRASR